MQPHNHLGPMHIPLKEEDIMATVAELQWKGIEFLSGPNVVDEGVFVGWRWTSFYDPDDITIELIEKAHTTPLDETIAACPASRPALEELV